MRRIAVSVVLVAGCGPSLIGVEDSTTTSSTTPDPPPTASISQGEEDGGPGDAVTSLTTAGSTLTSADATGMETGITTITSASTEGTTGEPEPLELDDCLDPPQFAINEFMMPPDTSVFGVAVFDANGTGGLDLVATDTSGRLHMWMGMGDGYFYAPTELQMEAGAQPHDIVTGDVNEDGVADLIVADHVGDRVWIVLADAVGGYFPPVAMDVVLQPWTMALADLDADGHLDLTVLIDRDHGYVLSTYGDGSGAFVPGAEFIVQSGPTEFALGDLDLNGAMDAFGTEVGGDLLVRQNVGGGFFDNAQTLVTFGSAHGAVAADLSGDGLPELVVASSDPDGERLHVWNGIADFGYGAPTSVITPFVLRHVIADDLGGSPSFDIAAVADDNGTAVLWLLLDWDSSAPCTVTIPILEGFPERLAAADLEGEGGGDRDFVVAMGPRLAFLLRE